MATEWDIRKSEYSDTESFESLHWMGYRLGDNRVFVDLTGIVLLGMKGDRNWVRKTLLVRLAGGKTEGLMDLEPPEEGFHWKARPVMWSVSAAPAAIYNIGSAQNAGWAVDTCTTAWDEGEPRSEGDLLSNVDLYMNLAVSDTDGILYRISFDFRAIGELQQERDIVILSE